jgi:hypothetical protein
MELIICPSDFVGKACDVHLRKKNFTQNIGPEILFKFLTDVRRRERCYENGSSDEAVQGNQLSAS